MLGSAFYSDRSQIAIRMLTSGEAVADETLIRARIDAAIAFRESLHIDGSAYRLVHGEADLLPSLVVDRYADYLVMQVTALAVAQRAGTISSILAELLQPRARMAGGRVEGRR